MRVFVRRWQRSELQRERVFRAISVQVGPEEGGEGRRGQHRCAVSGGQVASAGGGCALPGRFIRGALRLGAAGEECCSEQQGIAQAALFKEATGQEATGRGSLSGALASYAGEICQIRGLCAI